MSPTVADHVAQFLVDRGVELRLRPLRPHQHLPPGGTRAPRQAPLHHHAPRAGRRARRGRVRPGIGQARRGTAPRRSRASPTRPRASRRRRSTPSRCSSSPATSRPTTRDAGPTRSSTSARDADQVSVYEPFVKRAWRVRRADQVPRILARAWDLAMAGRPGPVLVSIPMDILAEAFEADVVPASPVAPPAITRETAATIAEELRTRCAAADPRRRRHATRRTGGARPRRAGRAPGRAHAHGHRSPAARSPAAARHDRVLGLADREPPGAARPTSSSPSGRASPRPTAAAGRTGSRSASRRRASSTSTSIRTSPVATIRRPSRR